MAYPSWNEWAFWLKDPESVRNLAFTVGSIAAIVGGSIGIALATMRTVAAMRQAKAATETQVTKLLTDAIGFLADKEKLELRLGAIYALERIAQNSRADLYRILEILYAFLRESTQRRIAESESIATIQPDVQACLDVIARNPPPRTFLRRHSARLTLANIDLRNVDLQGAKLRRVYLPGADLRGADLSNSDLRDANLSKARLNKARLNGCRMDHADLAEADLRECQIRGANLDHTKSMNVIFDGSDLRNSSFDRAQLQNASFLNANLEKADFGGSNLAMARLTNANIADANFRDRNVSQGPHGGSRTYPINLANVDFTGANREKAWFNDSPFRPPQFVTDSYRRLRSLVDERMAGRRAKARTVGD